LTGRLPYIRWQHATLVVGRLLLAGRADQAETANERALEIGTSAGAPEALSTFGACLYLIRLQQGRADEIADFFIDVARDSPSIAVLRVAVTVMLADLGRMDEARERLSAEIGGLAGFPYDVSWLAAMSDLLDTAAMAGDHGSARTLIDRVAPFATHVISPAPTLVRGAVARPLARAATLLGDHDQAEAWFSTAHDIHARLQAPYEVARGQLDHADLCLARRADDDLQRARDFVTTAAATAAEYGCAGLTTRAEILLADL
jgi:tetratricopeptide (TPR) repeat protein